MKLTTGDENVDSFLVVVNNELNTTKTDLIFTTDCVKIEECECGGYFSEDDNQVVVSFDSNNFIWLEYLIHEYSHYRQWVEKAPCSLDLETDDGSALEMMWSWLSNDIELKPKVKNNFINLVRDMELDCEIRAVECIKKYNLPIDVERYIKVANVYIYFHEIIKKYRKWYKNGISSSTYEDIIEIMPNKFLKQYKLTKKLEQMFLRFIDQ